MIRFLKMLDVPDPERNIPDMEAPDAGIDFFCPNDTPEFREMAIKKGVTFTTLTKEDNKQIDAIIILPHKSVCIPSGIECDISNDIALVATNKSGVATKKGLDVGACLIDPSYKKGMIHIHLTNTTDNTIYINFGEKIVQFVPYFVDYEIHTISDIKNISEEEFYRYSQKSCRGGNGFGSTGVTAKQC